MSRPRSGFTLVETLIALAIFGLLAVAGVALLNLSLTNREVVRAATEAGADFQRLRQLLRADLGQAVDRTVAGTGTGAGPAFAGGEGQVLLRLTRAGWSKPAGRPRASLQRVVYVAVDGRIERKVYPDLTGAGTPLTQTLLEDTREVRIAFVASGRTFAAWPGEAAQPLPDAVTLELTAPRFGRTTQWFLVGGGPG
ncbi:MAG: type II secretion system minor pseudopilin GspJ [Brevundimonas sp.]|uniref:type II secretion system minor pseudopilin GspJ n=1 Tax=Brevundimonas sp. TaxID=1871086 RepID=UPI00391EF376